MSHEQIERLLQLLENVDTALTAMADNNEITTKLLRRLVYEHDSYGCYLKVITHGDH